MKSGLLWDGLPRWVCEKFKKNLGEKFAECGTIGHQDGVGVNVVREEPIVLEEELFFDVYEGRFGNAVCSLCNYATEEGLDICRTCVASTTYVNPENYEDWTEEEIRRLDPFKEICVDKWLVEKGYSENHLRSFCQRCSVEIIAGEYCVDCAHVLGLPGLAAYDDEIVSPFLKRGVDINGEEAHQMPSEEVRRKLAQLAHGRNMSAEGTIPGRFPILMDPKRFHLANGHPNDELTRKICESSFGDPVSYTHLTLPTTPYV